MTTTPPTLGDLAKRLYTAHRDFTVKWADPLGINVATWDELGEQSQEAWLVVAREAVVVGGEIQREIERREDESLVNHPDFQTSLGQMERGEGRVLSALDEDILDILADGDDLADTAPKLAEIADRPRRFHRDCE